MVEAMKIYPNTDPSAILGKLLLFWEINKREDYLVSCCGKEFICSNINFNWFVQLSK